LNHRQYLWHLTFASTRIEKSRGRKQNAVNRAECR